jgi:hypothetical protein
MRGVDMGEAGDGNVLKQHGGNDLGGNPPTVALPAIFLNGGAVKARQKR